MSLDYASSLSPYSNKGKCGLPEVHDSLEEVNKKCDELVELINNSKHTVAITGAGISTSCGIPDFRGPNGVWTLEKQGKKPENSVSFESAKPSLSHYALVELAQMNKLNFLISQNIDGLHMRSGFPMNRLAELHGNMFMERCNLCSAKHLINKCVSTIGLKPTGKKCLKIKSKGNCRGDLHDTILDWEDALPLEDMQKSELNCKKSDLCLCLGTTLQIMPVGNYPLLTKKSKNGKIVVINLQPTRIDKSANLIIRYKLDEVFEIIFEKMNRKDFITKLNRNQIRINLQFHQDNQIKDDKSLMNVNNIVIDSDYEEKSSCEPDQILIFSGKRKSGKDYSCSKIVEYLNDDPCFNISLITLSAPLKEIYASEHKLDYDKLLDSSDYKEKYRLDMINWSDKIRAEDPAYFCRKAVEKCLQEKSIVKNKYNLWIVTDARRKTDLEYFRSTFPNIVKTVRVIADESVRKQRNWTFTEGVDDAISECDLDSVTDWNYKIENNNEKELENSLNKLVNDLKELSKLVTN